MFRLARSVAFARHIPISQIGARLALEASRRWAEKRPPALTVPPDHALRPAPAPPAPVFPPRAGMVSKTSQGWRFRFLGRSIDFAESVDWSIPPLAPDTQLWRMNLHYMEYLEELNAASGLALIEQWIMGNPPYPAGFWRDAWNSYTVSLRVVAWMQFIARHDLRPGTVFDSIARQMLFLERNLERDLGGNHLIKNIKALFWASTFFEGQLADRWRDLGTRLLRRELPRQILADGMHYERSPSYHAQVFADLIEIRHALGHDPLGGNLDSTLAAMARTTASLVHPDGLVAQFNDSGLTMAYPPGQCLDACQRTIGFAPDGAAGAFALPIAGYFGLRTADSYFIADMGRIGPDDLPAHAHGDIGSFELSVAGERMIVDQGVLEYVAGANRAASRSAANHNCLVLDGVDQADFYGAFRCGHRPDVRVDAVETGDGRLLLQGRHDGYRALRGRPVIVRRIQADRDSIEIIDRVECAEWHPGRIGFLLHPDCTVTIEGDCATIRRAGAALKLSASLPIGVEMANWWPNMGESHDTKRLFLTLPPGCFESRLDLRAVGAAAALGDL